MINTIMAEALDYCATSLETAVAAGTDFNEAVQTLLAEIVADHGAVIFNGNGYSDEWPIEAEQRGLKNLRTTVDALPELITPEAIELFAKYGVFNEGEAHSRFEIGCEQYILAVAVEANLTLEIGTTTILPAAMRYQTELAAQRRGAQGRRRRRRPLDARGGQRPDRRAEGRPGHAGATRSPTSTPTTRWRRRPTCATRVLPAMAAVRAAADALEGLVADDLWPLPTYQEMLYIL